MIVFDVLALGVVIAAFFCRPTPHWTTYSLDPDEYKRLQEHLNSGRIRKH
jgi:hypothetical protein